MRLSVVVNTCAFGPRAGEITGSASPTPHGFRAYALGNFIIPLYIADRNIDEVIVVGEWLQGEGYTYVHKPSTFFSCVDALSQRQAGFEAATGDVIVFMHDDHVLDFSFAATVRKLGMPEGVDVLLPARRKRNLGGYITLNNGSKDGYVSGHCVVMTRDACLRAPWKDVDEIHTWDVSHTKLLRDAGLVAKATDALVAWDVEIGARPEEA